ncbi:hypothetical protein FO519_010666, partial [Halicephalobus sp. NKZ332]
MAEQSSFENVISKPIETKKESVESSATSGADAEALSSMEAFSYDRGEPLLSSEIPEVITEEQNEPPSQLLVSSEIPKIVEEWNVDDTWSKLLNEDRMIVNEEKNELEYSVQFASRKPARRQSVTGVNTTVTQMDNFIKAM